VVADGAGRKREAYCSDKKAYKRNLDLRKDFSDEEIKDIITNVVFERSRDYYLSVGRRRKLPMRFLIP